MRLLERIKRAFAAGKVEYWEARPQNLSRAELDAAFDRDPDLSKLQRKLRESGDGVHGLDGEDHVYAGNVTVSAMGKAKSFYLKLFFWKKNDPVGEQGIEVQSFKPSEGEHV
jgi:hypothetical protein